MRAGPGRDIRGTTLRAFREAAAWFLVFASAAAAQAGQDKLPSVPPIAQEPPAPATRGLAAGEPMILEKARVEHKDGRVTLIFHVGGTVGGGPGSPGTGIATAIRPLIEPFKSPQGWIYENSALNLLAITDMRANAEKIAEILRAALTPEPQVRLEAQIVEIRWSKQLQVGFFGGQPNSGLWVSASNVNTYLQEVRANLSPEEALSSSPFIGTTLRFFYDAGSSGTFSGLMQSFAERGRAEIKSNPTVWARSGQEAAIESGERVPIAQTTSFQGLTAITTVAFEKTGVTLTVKPTVVGRDFLTLDVNEISATVTDRVEIATGVAPGIIFAPVITNRSIRTTVTARNGDEVVIGGLFRTETQKFRRGIPILMDIPILGFLFERIRDEEVVTEIVFIIRPIIYHTAHEIPRNLVPPPK